MNGSWNRLLAVYLGLGLTTFFCLLFVDRGSTDEGKAISSNESSVVYSLTDDLKKKVIQIVDAVCPLPISCPLPNLISHTYTVIFYQHAR